MKVTTHRDGDISVRLDRRELETVLSALGDSEYVNNKDANKPRPYWFDLDQPHTDWFWGRAKKAREIRLALERADS